MKRATLLALALLSLAIPAQAQPAQNADLQKISDAFMAAWDKGDAKALAALHAADAIRADTQWTTFVGRAAIEQAFTKAFAGELKGTKLAVKASDARSINPDLLVASGTWEITGGTPPPGAPTRGTYINTVIRQGGQWVIASSAPIPAPMKR
jgi:uncharacterized protein (TIGR02246 family)